MAAKKKKPEEKGAGASGSTRSLRDDAEEQLARSPKISPDLAGQTPEEVIHELQVHKIELEMQAEELRRSHLALEESQEKYLDLYEFAPTGYFTFTDKAFITDVNLTGSMLLGVERSTLIGAPLSKFIAEKDSDQWHRFFVNVRRHVKKNACTLMLKRGDRSIFPALLEGIRIPGSDGTIMVRIAISDLTDIRRAEEAEKEWIKELNCLYGMSTLLELPDISLNEILKRTVLLIPPAWQFPDITEACIVLEGRAFQTPRFRETSWMLAREIFVNGNPVGRVEVCYLEEWQTGNESPFVKEEHRLLTALAERLGRIIECKLADVALKSSESRYHRFFESVRDGILILDAETGTIIDVNPFLIELLGFTHEQFLGKKIWDIGIFKDIAANKDNFKELREKGYIHYENLPLETVDGRQINSEFVSVVYEVEHKKLMQCNIRDITERKRAEEALRQANKQLNILSSITRHDILNQLMALKGYLDLSHDAIDNPTNLIEYIKKEEKAANTIEHQIRFTKDYQNLGVVAPAWQNVNESIRKAMSALPMRDIHVETDPADPEVYADPLFEKVFYNLIDNALKYGGDPMKTIRVSSQESDRGLAIICEDDGVGISAEDKKRLFTRGFGKNTGLGLFLTREILSITGITITENGTPGKGARFEINVPKGMWRTEGKKE